MRGVCCHRNSTYELDGLHSAGVDSKRHLTLVESCSQLEGLRPLLYFMACVKV
jgi:hypothetical protein